jgi:hypothetical protein
MNRIYSTCVVVTALLVTGCGEPDSDPVWQDQLDMRDKAYGVEDTLDAASSRRDRQVDEMAQ